MAPTLEEQQFWVARLLKKIQKSGYKATGQVLVVLVSFEIAYELLLLISLNQVKGQRSPRRSR